jgi:hypothetical protein
MQIKSLHLTNGGPWHGVCTEGYEKWLRELRCMLDGNNPCAYANESFEDGRIVIDVEFSKLKGGD